MSMHNAKSQKPPRSTLQTPAPDPFQAPLSTQPLETDITPELRHGDPPPTLVQKVMQLQHTYGNVLTQRLISRSSAERTPRDAQPAFGWLSRSAQPAPGLIQRDPELDQKTGKYKDPNLPGLVLICIGGTTGGKYLFRIEGTNITFLFGEGKYFFEVTPDKKVDPKDILHQYNTGHDNPPPPPDSGGIRAEKDSPLTLIKLVCKSFNRMSLKLHEHGVLPIPTILEPMLLNLNVELTTFVLNSVDMSDLLAVIDEYNAISTFLYEAGVLHVPIEPAHLPEAVILFVPGLDIEIDIMNSSTYQLKDILKAIDESGAQDQQQPKQLELARAELRRRERAKEMDAPKKKVAEQPAQEKNFFIKLVSDFSLVTMLMANGLISEHTTEEEMQQLQELIEFLHMSERQQKRKLKENTNQRRKELSNYFKNLLKDVLKVAQRFKYKAFQEAAEGFQQALYKHLQQGDIEANAEMLFDLYQKLLKAYRQPRCQALEKDMSSIGEKVRVGGFPNRKHIKGEYETFQNTYAKKRQMFQYMTLPQAEMELNDLEMQLNDISNQISSPQTSQQSTKENVLEMYYQNCDGNGQYILLDDPMVYANDEAALNKAIAVIDAVKSGEKFIVACQHANSVTPSNPMYSGKGNDKVTVIRYHIRLSQGNTQIRLEAQITTHIIHSREVHVIEFLQINYGHASGQKEGRLSQFR